MARKTFSLTLLCLAIFSLTVWCSDDGDNPCGGRECGEVDGTSCGTCAGSTEVCSAEGICLDVCADRDCGEWEGADCGACSDATEVCTVNGFCVGVCQDRECGLVGDLDCGQCTPPERCSLDGRCVQPGCPADMVEMGLHGVCIDAFEHTVERFAAFLNEHGDDCSAGFETEINADHCVTSSPGWIVFQGGLWQPKPGMDQHPAPVTWYGAVAACAREGRRLCTHQEWQAACQGPDGWAYCYGPSYVPCACHIYDFDTNNCSTEWGGDIVPVGSAPQCEGGYPGLIDMIGNAGEWLADCLVDHPWAGTRSCEKHVSQLKVHTCTSMKSGRADSSISGFRCCLDQE